MSAQQNMGSYWSGGCFFRAWADGQARRSQRRYSGACGSPVRPPLRPPDGLIAEVEAAADGFNGRGGWGGGGSWGEWRRRRLGQSPVLRRRRVMDQPLVSDSSSRDLRAARK